MAMNNSGASFSVATTVFVSLAICAVISYGVFYYFKQRISVIEQSQMEQARIMQSFIARSIMHPNPVNQMMNQMNLNQMNQAHAVHKEVNITESGLIEVSSDSESESSESDSESESTTSESSSDCDNESGSGSEHRHETKRIQIQIQSLPDAEVTDVIVDDDDKPESSTKKIISLNKTALGDNESDDDDDDDDGESESGSEHHPDPDQSPFELNIGYKTKPPASKIHLNYGNMSVSALRQLAKERGLGGDDGDLQKLKKKDIVQLLQ